MTDDGRKPRSELRHWSTYTTVTEWFADHQGYVPIEMAGGLSRAMRERGLTFPEAYALLLGKQAIIHIDSADDAIPATSDVNGTGGDE